MRHVVVMVTSSYPRYPGDTVGSFMEPIARGVAARGHEVHLVVPWHPRLARTGALGGGVHLHAYRYAPLPSLNVFGYAGALREDVAVRWSAWIAAPLALAAGWRAARHVARTAGATVMHGHWVVPGGATACAARPALPLVVSLHGSDVFVAERHRIARSAARAVFARAGWVTACSDDLLRRAVALGANPHASEVVPYGVDVSRFQPRPGARGDLPAAVGALPPSGVVAAVGRLVRKKGFAHLIEAVAALVGSGRDVTLLLAGGGDLDAELRERARAAGVADRVRFLGPLDHDRVAHLLAAADVVAVPSVHDDEGNVDGLPNVVLEALASGTATVATTAGGLAAVIRDGETGLLVPERDSRALAAAIGTLLDDPSRRAALGAAARADMEQRFGWARVAARFEAAYERAVLAESGR
jgi:glycosyltransferase involved in cell wall biosynthesis